MNEAPTQKPSPVPLLVIALFAALAFLAVLSIPSAPPENNLDGSWSGAYAYFFLHRLHAGTDYIFTYGPLGFLMTSYADPQTFWLRWVYEIALKVYIVVETIRLIRLPDPAGHKPAWWLALPPLSLTALLFAFSIYSGFTYIEDGFSYVVFLVLATAPIRDRRLSTARVVVTLLIISAFSLEKATLLALAVPVVALCALRAMAQRFEGSTDAAPVPPIVRTLSQPLLLFPVIWLALWLLAGQTLGNIVPYFVGSLSVASGYNEAMAFMMPGYRNSFIPFLLAVAMVLALLAAIRVQADGLLAPRGEKPAASRFDKPLVILFSLFLAFLALLAWKHGFTRGGDHTIIFFLMTGFAAPFLAVVFADAPKPATRYALLGIVAAGAAFGCLRGDDGWFHTDAQQSPIVGSLKTFVNPLGTLAGIRSQEADLRASADLPQTRSAVGNGTIDYWSYLQETLLINGLHYQPHPSLQGYNDYTAYLQEQDMAFWMSDAAPQFLLFNPQAIDFRYPTIDGGPSFAAMLERYEPVLSEKDSILMRRREPSAPLNKVSFARDSAPETEVAIGDWVDVPAISTTMLEMVAIDITSTPAGVARRLLFKPADIYLEVQISGHEKPVTYRLIPEMAREGFVLNPLLVKPEDVLAMYAGQPSHYVTRMRIRTDLDSKVCYAPTVKLKIYVAPFSTGAPMTQ